MFFKMFLLSTLRQLSIHRLFITVFWLTRSHVRLGVSILSHWALTAHPKCLILINSRSLPSKIGTFRYFRRNHSWAIILITETWLTGYTWLNQLFLSNYISFLTHWTNRCGDGCPAYVKREWQTWSCWQISLRHNVIRTDYITSYHMLTTHQMSSLTRLTVHLPSTPSHAALSRRFPV